MSKEYRGVFDDLIEKVCGGIDSSSVSVRRCDARSAYVVYFSFLCFFRDNSPESMRTKPK